jgi:hypothetical protein
MPFLPPGTPANVLTNFHPRTLASWMDGEKLPIKAPHTLEQPDQFGCTINKDFNVKTTGARFKKDMQGRVIEVKLVGNQHLARVYIQGVTEYLHDGHWVQSQWIPVDYVNKGDPWKADMKDWNITAVLPTWSVEASKWMAANVPDNSVLGITVSRLIETFDATPSPFMTPKLRELIQHRGVQSIVKAIIKGIKDANTYNVLNNSAFSCSEVLGGGVNTRHTIDSNYDSSQGGIYIRWHKSNSSVTYWEKNTEFIYVGKTVHFRARYEAHKASTSSYGDLTRNSRSLVMTAVCLLDDTEVRDIAYLTEQLFVCLLQTYRHRVLPAVKEIVRDDAPLRHIEALEAASYFDEVSEKVFRHTGWRGAVKRRSFGVSYGANYSSPLTEWGTYHEKNLYIRTDSLIKIRETNRTVPIAVFRSAKPKKASYTASGQLPVFKTTALRLGNGKTTRMGVSSSKVDREEGVDVPIQDSYFHVVFEVIKDGSPHPEAWSRLPSIGPYENWDQGRSLAVRIEWEHPPNSGTWRFRYIQAHSITNFMDKGFPGTLKVFAKTIALLGWLFDAKPNHNHSWIPHSLAPAHVLQAFYDMHNQRIEIKRPEKGFEMHSGALKPINEIITAMRAPELGLLNVNGTFGDFTGSPITTGKKRTRCDMCVLLSPKLLKRLGIVACQKVGSSNVCTLCVLLGRGVCSWTATSYISGPSFFTENAMSGTSKKMARAFMTMEDVHTHKLIQTALVQQPPWDNTGHEQTFEHSLVKFGDSATEEDDFNYEEDEDEDEDEDGGEVGEGDGDDSSDEEDDSSDEDDA